MLNKEIRSARLVYTRPWTLKVSSASATTMESLPLKKLDFGLQKFRSSSFHSFDYNSFVFRKFVVFSHNSHTIQIVLGELQDTCTLNHFLKKF